MLEEVKQKEQIGVIEMALLEIALQLEELNHTLKATPII